VIAFAKKRIGIAQDLLKRQEARQLRPDQEYNVLKRSVTFALRDVARAANVLARQIGGVRTVRDQPGTGRDPLTPVPITEQREALDLITGSLLAADSLRVSPELQRKLGADFSERSDALRNGEGSAQTDYSPSVQVLGMQRSLLGALMSDTIATRLLESSEKAPAGSDRALRMSELYDRLSKAVWSELDARADIAPLRREVQRDHVNRIAAVLKEVEERGPISAGELSGGGKGTGSWWGWSDGKRALEWLFWAGEVTTRTRRGFERIYDLPERALPASVLNAPTPPEDEAQRELLRLSIRSLGVASERCLRDYFRLLPQDAKAPEIVHPIELLDRAYQGGTTSG